MPAETEALVVGKPSLEFFRAGVRRLGLSPGEVAMVGDDLWGDVVPAMDAGLVGIQVRTGKYREERYAASPRKADRVAADLAEAVDRILGRDGRRRRSPGLKGDEHPRIMSRRRGREGFVLR